MALKVKKNAPKDMPKKESMVYRMKVFEKKPFHEICKFCLAFFNPKPSGLFGRSIQWGGVDLRLNGF